MRWRLADEEVNGQSALFGVDELTGPQRGTGRLSGQEFLHVTARTIISEVPAQSQMPFRHTINVYRGCSHACVYCLGGETPILMADGRTKLLREIEIGDLVYGTERRGTYRHYVPTPVLAHWQTTKRAFRVSLADGTTLLASGDHRLLTGRGWKYVSDNPAERRRRAHLTTSNSLLGTGQLADAPKHCSEYQQGYLTGMIRGDANLGTYYYQRAGHRHGAVHGFRLALTDSEPLERSRRYLHDAGIQNTQFAFSPKSETRRALTAIRTSSESNVASIRTLIAWPGEPSGQWWRGFLAGIFDAEGSHSNGVLRISNGDAEILDWISAGLTGLQFGHVVEAPRPNGVRCVRLTGGLRERLRFFLSTDPATTRKRTIHGVALKSNADVRVVSVQDTGLEMPMFDITTGTGDFIADGVVSHNCFARPTHEYLGLNLGEDFDQKIVVKINAIEKLRAELRSPSWAGACIAMGTNTDPYQRCEGKYRLTRGVVEALSERANPFSILTKSALVLRDLDLIAAAARRTEVSVSFSIATLDERVWRATEPGSPHPRRRLEAMRRFAEAGVRTGALIAPILPALSDSPAQLEEIGNAVRATSGRILGVMPLHLRPGVREHFLGWLAGFDPVLHEDYVKRYRARTYAPKDYAERLRALVDGRGPT